MTKAMYVTYVFLRPPLILYIDRYACYTHLNANDKLELFCSDVTYYLAFKYPLYWNPNDYLIACTTT